MPNKRPIRAERNVQQRAKELRRDETDAEIALWKLLRGRKLGGFKFRRQHPIGRFIADFYCADAKLIVELDGEIHLSQIESDTERTEWLKSHGYIVIRFSNDQILNDFGTTARTILKFCNERTTDE